MTMTCNLAQLHSAIADMDLPELRKTATSKHDIAWLNRNIGCRNADHPRFEEARNLLRRILVSFEPTRS